ncbi:MAG: hypothetical protein ABII25_00335 [bacterium]
MHTKHCKCKVCHGTKINYKPFRPGPESPSLDGDGTGGKVKIVKKGGIMPNEYPKRNNEESKLQALFAGWLDSQGILFNASMAGVNLGINTAVTRHRMGAKAGFPDIMIFEARGGYHGLALELKAMGGNDKNRKQRIWQEFLQARGYKALIMPTNLELLEGLKWLQDEVEKYLKG